MLTIVIALLIAASVCMHVRRNQRKAALRARGVRPIIFPFFYPSWSSEDDAHMYQRRDSAAEWRWQDPNSIDPDAEEPTLPPPPPPPPPQNPAPGRGSGAAAAPSSPAIMASVLWLASPASMASADGGAAAAAAAAASAAAAAQAARAQEEAEDEPDAVDSEEEDAGKALGGSEGEGEEGEEEEEAEDGEEEGVERGRGRAAQPSASLAARGPAVEAVGDQSSGGSFFCMPAAASRREGCLPAWTPPPPAAASAPSGRRGAPQAEEEWEGDFFDEEEGGGGYEGQEEEGAHAPRGTFVPYARGEVPQNPSPEEVPVPHFSPARSPLSTSGGGSGMAGGGSGSGSNTRTLSPLLARSLQTYLHPGAMAVARTPVSTRQNDPVASAASTPDSPSLPAASPASQASRSSQRTPGSRASVVTPYSQSHPYADF